MAKRLVVSAILLIGVSWFLPLAYSQIRQPGAVYDFDRKGEKPSPAPRRDISGIWLPAAGANVGIQANGAQMMPSDGRPEHELPFTAAGRAAFLANKPSVGVTAVTPALTNDPVKGGVTGTGCDPVGFPRLALWNFRTTRIIQSPENVVVLYMLNNKWRVIGPTSRSSQKSWTSHAGMDTPWADGRMTTRSSLKRLASIRARGSTRLAARMAKHCAWRNGTNVWTATICC